MQGTACLGPVKTGKSAAGGLRLGTWVAMREMVFVMGWLGLTVGGRGGSGLCSMWSGDTVARSGKDRVVEKLLLFKWVAPVLDGLSKDGLGFGIWMQELLCSD